MRRLCGRTSKTGAGPCRRSLGDAAGKEAVQRAASVNSHHDQSACLPWARFKTASLTRPSSNGRVAMGGYPPMAPTDPDLTLEHPVPQVTPSLRRRHDAAANPSLAIRWRFGDTKREFNASQVFLANDVVTRCLASHPPGPRGSSSPASTVLSRHCDFLPPFPPRFVSLA